MRGRTPSEPTGEHQTLINSSPETKIRCTRVNLEFLLFIRSWRLQEKCLPLRRAEKTAAEGTKSSLFYFLLAVDTFFIEEKIHELLAAKFQEETFQDCFLVEFNLHQGNKLEVFMDCDSGLTLSKCQQISRYLESSLDEQGWLGESYVLEVSSPGLSRPLKFRRQYVKNIGRNLEITLDGGNVKTGVLKSVNESSIILEEKAIITEGKKKKKTVVQTELPFDHIKKAMIVISF